MNEELILDKGQAMCYGQFGNKFVISSEELEEMKNNCNVRKIYFNDGERIIRIK